MLNLHSLQILEDLANLFADYLARSIISGLYFEKNFSEFAQDRSHIEKIDIFKLSVLRIHKFFGKNVGEEVHSGHKVAYDTFLACERFTVEGGKYLDFVSCRSCLTRNSR